MPRSRGTHIPWYGINGLYYHDADFNYYQVYYDGTQYRMKDESDTVYSVVGAFDVNSAEEQTLTYLDGENQVSLQLSGNQTTASSEGKVASATLHISQDEVLSIANVPAGTQYEIVELAASGYSLVNIAKRIEPNDIQEIIFTVTITPWSDKNVATSFTEKN